MSEIFLSIIERIKEIKHLHSDAQVAKALDMTKNNLYAFKNRPSLPLKQIHAFCSREGVKLEYLIEGKPPVYGEDPGPWPKIPGHGTGTRIGEQPPPYHPNNAMAPGAPNITPHPSTLPTTRTQDLLSKTAAIIGSQTPFAYALKSNIEAFSRGLALERDLAAYRAMLNAHTSTIEHQNKIIEEQNIRLNTFEDRLRSMENKKAG